MASSSNICGCNRSMNSWNLLLSIRVACTVHTDVCPRRRKGIIHMQTLASRVASLTMVKR
jgi:hypothetical protein